jgi:peptidyl-dipeptidase Dcp
MADNPFSQPSTLPYQLPPFDRISNADYLPGFEQGMSEQRAQVRAIADNPAPADFANTVLALERSGQMLNRVSAAFFNLNASNTDPQMQQIDSEIAPRLQAHEDAI